MSETSSTPFLGGEAFSAAADPTWTSPVPLWVSRLPPLPRRLHAADADERRARRG